MKMKRILNTTLAIAMVSAVLVAGSAHAAVVAHYTFDNSSDRYADATGNGWDGRLVGSGTSFGTGVSRDAMKSTTNSKMVVDTSSTGQGDIAASLAAFTISFWANDSVNNWDNWVSFGNDSFELQNTSSNTLAMYNPGGTPGYPGGLASSTAFGASLLHVVIAADSSEGKIRLYIDGNLEDTANWTVAATSTLGWFAVGGLYGTSIRNIDATIDDVQIYDEALDQDQVTILYNHPGEVYIPAPAALPAGLALLGLVALRRRQ